MLLPRFPSQPTGMHSPSTQIRRPSSSQEVPSTTCMLSCSTFYIPLIHYASKTLHGLTFFIDILKPFWHGDNRTSLLWAYSWARTFLGLSSRESNRSTFAQTALGWTSHTAPPCIHGHVLRLSCRLKWYPSRSIPRSHLKSLAPLGHGWGLQVANLLVDPAHDIR